MLLSRDDILKADDRKTEDVEVPEWGGTVRLRMLTGTERDRFEQFMAAGQSGKKSNLDNFRARMITLCIVDDQGAPVFTSGDIRALGAKSSAALSRVFDACQRMNGFTEADVEEMTEDFTDAPDGPSTSA